MHDGMPNMGLHSAGKSWNETFETLITKTGTTIVGICCKDGVVLGADTRSTGGPLVVDKNKLKIHNISPRIYSCAAGTSADCDQLTRRAKAHLALKLVEHELSGEHEALNSVASAVQCIASSLWQNGRRKPSAVFLIGGVDNTGGKLYQINGDLFPLRVPFGSLGSGSTDALAVLETSCAGLVSASQMGEVVEATNLTVSEAIDIVRKAVQAGIINDLGSGSHVDLCVITKDEVRLWRERLLSAWDEDRPDSVKSQYIADNEPRMHRGDIDLGKRVWSRTVAGHRLLKGKIVKHSHTVDPLHTRIDVQKI